MGAFALCFRIWIAVKPPQVAKLNTVATGTQTVTIIDIDRR